MAERTEETLMEKIAEKIRGSDSSESDDDKSKQKQSQSSFKSKINRLFGRERPVHSVLGGGRPADIFLWKDKKASATVLGGATAIWVLFELMECHLLSLIPQLSIPEDLAVNIALALRFEINRSLAVLKEIASGRELKKFLAVIAGLWFLSLIGSSCSFLTLLYAVIVLVHTVPFVYEKYEDKIDFYWEKAVIEIKKQYAVFDAKVLSKIPKGPSKNKKH